MKSASSSAAKKKKQQVVDLDPDFSEEDSSNSDSGDDEDILASVFASKGTPSSYSFGYSFMPIFRHASFAKFWEVNQKKNVVVDRPVREFDLKRVNVFKCISSAMLLKSVTIPRSFVMDVILEFYLNLSMSMFDAKSLDYYKAFVRGKFFDVS